MSKKCNLGLIIYEIRNLSGNLFVHFFGVIFPIVMSMIISSQATKEVPESMKQEVVTAIVITMSLIIPMAIMLMGYAANYSNEIEKNVPLRMRLFGYNEKSIILAKLIAQLIFLTVAMAVYAVAEVILLDLQKPALLSLIILVVSLYLVAIIFFMLAHGVANILKKFGPTYVVTMSLYFLFMMLCGMMGIQSDQLPKPIKTIAFTLPMTYISNEYIDFWQGQSYNFMPVVQSFLFLGALAGIVLMFSFYKNRRKIA